MSSLLDPIQIIALIILMVLLWGTNVILFRSKSFQDKPEAERKRLKKHLQLGVWLAPFVFVGCHFLSASKSTAWVPWVFFASYLAIWGLGGYFLWKAYRLLIRKEIALLKRTNGEPFKSPEKFLVEYGQLYLFMGMAFWGLAVAIFLYRINMQHWAIFIVLISAIKQFAHGSLEKRDDA